MSETTTSSAEETSNPQAEGAVQVEDVQFPQAHEQPNKSAPGQIDLLLDISVKVQACLGEVEIQVRDLLQLNTGSVITLDRQVGEPADLYLKGARFATGYLVVIGNRLGIRIKEVLPAAVGAAQ
jgi:flagellar motor switch protein FliN/FliY